MRRRWQFYRPAAPAAGLRTALLLTLAFVALATVSRVLCLDQQQSTVFWAANGAMVVALLVLPGRYAALVLALCFAANLALNLITSYEPLASSLYCGLNVGLSIAVAFFTRRFCGATTDLSRPAGSPASWSSRWPAPASRRRPAGCWMAASPPAKTSTTGCNGPCATDSGC